MNKAKMTVVSSTVDPINPSRSNPVPLTGCSDETDAVPAVSSNFQLIPVRFRRRDSLLHFAF